jgi:hypothetical protein
MDWRPVFFRRAEAANAAPAQTDTGAGTTSRLREAKRAERAPGV